MKWNLLEQTLREGNSLVHDLLEHPSWIHLSRIYWSIICWSTAELRSPVFACIVVEIYSSWDLWICMAGEFTWAGIRLGRNLLEQFSHFVPWRLRCDAGKISRENAPEQRRTVFLLTAARASQLWRHWCLWRHQTSGIASSNGHCQRCIRYLSHYKTIKSSPINQITFQ